jgi:hypothetical protein
LGIKFVVSSDCREFHNLSSQEGFPIALGITINFFLI